MVNFKREFTDEPHREYEFKIGKTFATGTAGFLAGFVAAAVVLIPLSIYVCKSGLR